MSERNRAMIDYVVACVNDFSERHAIPMVLGFDYLRQRGGIDFLERNYDIEHTYSIEEALEDLTTVCRRNGGTL